MLNLGAASLRKHPAAPAGQEQSAAVQNVHTSERWRGSLLLVQLVLYWWQYKTSFVGEGNSFPGLFTHILPDFLSEGDNWRFQLYQMEPHIQSIWATHWPKHVLRCSEQVRLGGLCIPSTTDWSDQEHDTDKPCVFVECNCAAVPGLM